MSSLIWCLFAAFACAATFPRVASAQGACGGKPCPRIIVTTNRPARSTVVPPRTATPPRTTTPSPRRPAANRPRGGGIKNPDKQVAPPVEVTPCDDAELVVVCHMPGCEITLNSQERHVTDGLGGFTFQVPGNQRYRLRVAKPGYAPFERTETKLDCGDQREVNAQLTAKPVALRIHTVPTECDIYLDRQKQPVGSDSSGRFSYVLSNPTLLIEAKKAGYLSATQTIVLAPEWASREVVLELEPISARLKLSVNVDDAQVTIDNDQAKKDAHDRLLLRPGPHVLTVEALGYAPFKFDLKVGPDESISKEIRLERLPLSALHAQAESLLAKRAYDDVLKLARYIRDTNPDDAVAHRLAGLVHLARGDFSNAGGELNKALAGGESFSLPIRRHSGEKFDFNKGHDACTAQLFLSKSELEFRSARNPADNFKVTYDQIQVVGVQLKSGVASYLATKVTAGGKRRDYNFYSFDKEISAAGKTYLEMIQRLLRSH